MRTGGIETQEIRQGDEGDHADRGQQQRGADPAARQPARRLLVLAGEPANLFLERGHFRAQPRGLVLEAHEPCVHRADVALR